MDSCSFFRGILLLCLALIASSDATTLVPTQVLVPLSSPEAVQWASIAKYAATVANQRWAGAYAISVDIVDAGGDPFSTTTAAQSAGANSTVLAAFADSSNLDFLLASTVSKQVRVFPRAECDPKPATGRRGGIESRGLGQVVAPSKIPLLQPSSFFPRSVAMAMALY